MLGSTKPLASLSSGLLARKGQARPAMRPQGFHGQDFGPGAMSLEDLGWNDMGDPDKPAPVVSIAPAAAPIAPPVTIVPPVLVERETLREAIAPEAAPEPVVAPVKSVSVATAARIDREVRASETKAAFTLRLDADRHLRLRLASATRNRSAQALVIEALDAFIATLPEVEGLATQLTASKTTKTSGGRTS